MFMYKLHQCNTLLSTSVRINWTLFLFVAVGVCLQQKAPRFCILRTSNTSGPWHHHPSQPLVVDLLFFLFLLFPVGSGCLPTATTVN